MAGERVSDLSAEIERRIDDLLKDEPLIGSLRLRNLGDVILPFDEWENRPIINQAVEPLGKVQTKVLVSSRGREWLSNTEFGPTKIVYLHFRPFGETFGVEHVYDLVFKDGKKPRLRWKSHPSDPKRFVPSPSTYYCPEREEDAKESTLVAFTKFLDKAEPKNVQQEREQSEETT